MGHLLRVLMLHHVTPVVKVDGATVPLPIFGDDLDIGAMIFTNTWELRHRSFPDGIDFWDV